MTQAPGRPAVIGIAGWKNSGKTTLVTRLIAELTRRGFRVASIKHAHHDFQIDDGETDSARHRRAGAAQVAIVSARRWALVRELGEQPEPSLETMIARLDPCDIVIVEGYKATPIAKIETRRREAVRQTPLADTDPDVIAIASDYDCVSSGRPILPLDDVAAVADFIMRQTGLAGGDR